MRLNLIRCDSNKANANPEVSIQKSDSARKGDLINELREYRQCLRDRTPSPTKTFKIVSRPVSALFQRSKSLLQTVRAADFSPLKEHSTNVAAQEQVSERLRRGGRQFTVHNINPLFKLAEFESSIQKRQLIDDLLQKEAHGCRYFIDSLKNLSNLKFDFELNFELVRGNDFANCKESPKLGTYYWLEKEMNTVMGGSYSDVFSLNKDSISQLLQEYTQCLRDILRSVKGLNGKNEAVLLDLLWRLVIKLFDKALSSHNYQIELAVENQQVNMRQARDQFEVMNLEYQAKIKEEVQKKENEIKLLKKKIKDLKSTQTYLEQEVLDRDIKIAELTEIDHRVETVGNFENLIKKLNRFIGESENEHLKNITTLKSLADVMNLAETRESSREIRDFGSMTEINYSSYESPRGKIRRNHPFDHIAIKEYDTVHLRDENVLDICEIALEESKGTVPFHRQLLMILAEQMQDSKALLSHANCIKQAIQNSKTFEFCYFQKLLGVDYQIPQAIENYLFQIRKSLMTHEKTPYEIALPELLLVLSDINSSLFIKIFNKLKPLSLNRSSISLGESSFFTYVEKEHGLNIGAEKLEFLLCRIALGFNASGFSIKKVLDELDSSKKGLIWISELISWMVQHLPLKVNEDDLNMLKRYLSPGDRVKVSIVLDRFNIPEYQEKAEKLLFSRYEVLYYILEDIEFSYDKLLKDCSTLLVCKNKSEISEMISRLGGSISPSQDVEIFIDILIDSTIPDLLSKYNCLGFYSKRKEESTKIKKSVKRKKGKSKRASDSVM